MPGQEIIDLMLRKRKRCAEPILIAAELAPSLPSVPDRAVAGDRLLPSLTSRPPAERPQDGVEHAVEVLAHVLGQEAQDEIGVLL